MAISEMLDIIKEQVEELEQVIDSIYVGEKEEQICVCEKTGDRYKFLSKKNEFEISKEDLKFMLGVEDDNTIFFL